MRTLWESPVLAPIAKAAEIAGLDIVLFGSVASRAQLFDAAGVEVRDLFELCEHASDIDIAHNGPPSATRRLEKALAVTVPMAPWFRWSIIDRKTFSTVEALREHNIEIPLRDLRLGMAPSRDEERTAELLSEALEGRVDLIDKGRFDDSPRSKRDTEASAAMLYVEAWIDVLEAQRRSGRHLGVAPSDSGILRSGVARLQRLEGGGRRLALNRSWYRLAGLALRLSPRTLRYAREAFDLEPLFAALEDAGFPVRRLSEEADLPFTLSAHLADGEFRFPTAPDKESSDISSEAHDLPFGHVEAGDEVPLKLAEGNAILRSIHGLPATKGSPPSAPANDLIGGEFLYVAFPLPKQARSRATPDRLSALVVGRAHDGAAFLPVFASVSVASDFWVRSVGTGKRCTARLNLTDSLQGVESLDIHLVQRLRA